MTIDDFEVGMWVRYGNHTGEVVGIVKGLPGIPDFKNIEVKFSEIVKLSYYASQWHTFYYNEAFWETVDYVGGKRKISDLTIIEKVEEETMTIDDFKVGTRVKHEEYGEGIIIKNIGNLIEIDFESPQHCICFYPQNVYGVGVYTIDTLTIIEEPKTTEEKLCKPITKENINEVLEYNGWKYDGENYNHYQSTKDGFVVDYTILLADVKFKFNYYLRSDYGSIQTDDFDEFLTFVQKRIELKPIPKKPKFDFKQYLLDNGFLTKEESTWIIIKNYITIWIFNNHFELLADTTTFAKTKENADILIATAKLLEGLK